jgi:hypothetical protein
LRDDARQEKLGKADHHDRKHEDDDHSACHLYSS